jgi:enediyne biosynthesis protein E4
LTRNKIETGDFNKDGKPDLIIGNMGLNTQFQISEEEPGEMYFKDFDNNGSVDPFFCFSIQGKRFPYVTRDEMLEQIAPLRKRYTTFSSYADATLTDVFKEEDLKSAGYLKVNHLATTFFQSTTKGQFTLSELPVQVQYSPVNTISVLDYNHDGKEDLLLCGNNSKTKLRLGKFDANYGVLLKGNGKGGFEYINQRLSGFNLKGDVKSVVDINHTLLFGINQQPVVAYRLRGK